MEEISMQLGNAKKMNQTITYRRFLLKSYSINQRTRTIEASFLIIVLYRGEHLSSKYREKNNSKACKIIRTVSKHSCKLSPKYALYEKKEKLKSPIQRDARWNLTKIKSFSFPQGQNVAADLNEHL